MSRPPINYWPLMIGAIGIFFLGITGWSIYRAASGVSSVTDPAYYSHGLKYNNTDIELRAAETMGWTMEANFKDRHLEVMVFNRDQQPVSGGQASLALHAGLAGTKSTTIGVTISETAPGIYSATLPLAIEGEVSADFSMSRQGAAIQRRLLLAGSGNSNG